MKTCLVVDDSKVVRMVARKILEELGFAVSEAEDGQVALDMSMQSMPDVVLLDWNMPVMSGIEYLRALRVTDEGKNRSWCSARPRTICPISRKVSLPAPTNTS